MPPLKRFNNNLWKGRCPVRTVGKLVCFLALLPLFLGAETIYDFIPRHSQLVLQVNLNDIAGMKTIQDDLIRNVSRQTGISKDKDKSLEFNGLAESFIIVMPVLTEDEFLIFVKTKGAPQDFRRRLEEMTGIRHTSVKNQGLEEHHIILEDTSLLPGVQTKTRTFAWAFIGKNIAVCAKDNLNGYLKYLKDRGLAAERRKELTGDKLLAAGFVEITPDFLAENPFLPQIRRAVYSIGGEPSGAVRIKALAACSDDKNANQTQIQFQQYVMVGGIMLNQLDPELMQEWVSAIRVSREKNDVLLNAAFAAAFINRLAAASEKVAAQFNPTAQTQSQAQTQPQANQPAQSKPQAQSPVQPAAKKETR